MARIRTIKPSFWSDPAVVAMSRDARLLCLGLICHADDEGRFVATTATMAGAVFPHDDLSPKTIRTWRDEIDKAGIVALYQVDGFEYGHFPKWKLHQKVYKAYPSAIPPPPASFHDSDGSRP